jgi:hypothetical protein
MRGELALDDILLVKGENLEKAAVASFSGFATSLVVPWNDMINGLARLTA